MVDLKHKNRRYRGAKISEYRLKRVVTCFACNLSPKQTAEATKLSPPAVEAIFQRLRERMLHHGLVRFNFESGDPLPARPDLKPGLRSMPEQSRPLYAAEAIHRVLCAQHLKGFERLPAADPASVDKVKQRLAYNHNQKFKRYRVWEELNEPPLPTGAKPTRPFNPYNFKADSQILINEAHASPQDAFFTYLWGLLLRHPL